MRVAKFSVTCQAVYTGSLEIPDEVKEGEELDYIRKHLDEVPTEDLTWLADLPSEDAVTEDDIRYIEGERDEEAEQDR